MQSVEPASTQESTGIMVKILDSTFAKADMKQVVNDIKLNAKERTLLLRLLEEFKDLFNVTLGYWDTEPVDIELKLDYKPFNSRYYLVAKINK